VRGYEAVDLFEHGVPTRNAGLPRYLRCSAAWSPYYPASSIHVPRIVCARTSRAARARDGALVEHHCYANAECLWSMPA